MFPLDLDKFSFVIKVNLIGTFNVLSPCCSRYGHSKSPLDEDGSRGVYRKHGPLARPSMARSARHRTLHPKAVSLE